MKTLLVLVLSLVIASFAFANVDKADVEEALAAQQAGLELTKAQDALVSQYGGIGNVIDNWGGPDAGGYAWKDSEEVDGPDYAWNDITGTGTSVIGDVGDDSVSGPYPIGFTFTFYGVAYSDFYINSNGTINFMGAYVNYSNYEMPYSGRDEVIAWFWDDLDPADATDADVLYETMTVGEQTALVVSFLNWDEYAGNTDPDGQEDITAQVILFEDGTIQMHYNSVESAEGLDIAGSTIGIQNADGTIGLTVLYNGSIADYPYDGLAIEFFLGGPTPDASLSGYVYDADTELPLVGATVALDGVPAFTGEDGFYEFPSLFSGLYPYEVSKGGYIAETGDIDVLPGTNTADFYLVPMSMEADVLIVDVDPTVDSGPAIQGVLNDLGYTTYYTNDFFGAPFGDYDYVFVFTGMYPNYYAIGTDSAEETACVDYLNAGGCLYLEGGDLYGWNPPANLLAMLQLTGISDGSGDLDNVLGEGDLAGLDLVYAGENSYIDHIEPSGDAFRVLYNPADGAGCGVLDNSLPYYYACFSFELGMLVDGVDWTRADIVGLIMDTFAGAPPELIQMTMIPLVDVVAPGEDIVYDIHLLSLVENLVYGVRYQTFATAPGGYVMGPIDDLPFILYPFMDHVYPGMTATVPLDAPAGIYTFEGVAFAVGNHAMFKSDSFEFEVTGEPGETWLEDFEDGLAQDFEFFVGDGSYSIDGGYCKFDQVLATEWGSGVYTGGGYGDFTVTSTHEMIVTDGYSLGLLYRGDGPQDGDYTGYAVYCSNGHYSAWEYTAGWTTNLVGWTESAFINQGVGAINELSIVATGTNFDFYSNGNYVGSWENGAHAYGYVGIATCYSNETWFDDIGVTLPAAGANMAAELGELETVLRDDMGIVITDPADYYVPGVAFDRSEDIRAEFLSGNWVGNGSIITGEEAGNVSLPTEFAMGTAYPNPFNPTASVAIALPNASDLTVTVFNVMGQQVATLANGKYNAGQHNFVFNASNLASGLYFIQAQVPGELNAVQKVTLMK